MLAEPFARVLGRGRPIRGPHLDGEGETPVEGDPPRPRPVGVQIRNQDLVEPRGRRGPPHVLCEETQIAGHGYLPSSCETDRNSPTISISGRDPVTTWRGVRTPSPRGVSPTRRPTTCSSESVTGEPESPGRR